MTYKESKRLLAKERSKKRRSRLMKEWSEEMSLFAQNSLVISSFSIIHGYYWTHSVFACVLCLVPSVIFILSYFYFRNSMEKYRKMAESISSENIMTIVYKNGKSEPLDFSSFNKMGGITVIDKNCNGGQTNIPEYILLMSGKTIAIPVTEFYGSRVIGVIITGSENKKEL